MPTETSVVTESYENRFDSIKKGKATGRGETQGKIDGMAPRFKGIILKPYGLYF